MRLSPVQGSQGCAASCLKIVIVAVKLTGHGVTSVMKWPFIGGDVLGTLPNVRWICHWMYKAYLDSNLGYRVVYDLHVVYLEC